jgi:hypothetical protein
MDYAFKGASSFTDQNLSSWNVHYVAPDGHRDFMTGSGSGNTEPSW